MKMNFFTRLAFSSLFITMSVLPAISQSIKYNGEIETGVVVHTKFATSQKCGIYLKFGYTYQSATQSWEWYADGIKHAGSERYNAGGFSTTIGFRFN